MFLFFLVLFSGLASSLALWLLLPYLQSLFLDEPNARSSHQHPTPRAGGLVFVLASALSSASILLRGVTSGLDFNLLFLFVLPLAIVGYLDDRYKLSAGIRYGVQIVTALMLVLISDLPVFWFLLPLMVIAITAVINFTNFMDGLDGLVGSCMAVTIAALAIVLDAPWPLWSLVGSLLGFLLWNWSPAKVFMGDVGSTFLGAVFVGLVLQSNSWSQALGCLLVATPLLADACFCVPRRLLAGQRVFQAHRLHLFQRLHQAGWSHARVSLAYVMATTFLSVALLVGGWHLVFPLAVLVLLLGLWLDQRVAVPFSVASKSR